MDPARVRLRVLGGSPLHGSDALGFADGDCPWNLSLGVLVMGNLMGRHFWVDCGCFFLGTGGGEEELQGATVEAFSQDDASSKQPCFYVIYYMLSSGGFAAHAFRPSRRVSSILEALGSVRALFKLRQPVDLCHTLRQ